jgi:hypothetical protein
MISRRREDTAHSTIRAVQTIQTAPRYERAVIAVDELLATLRIDHLFVGDVARAAWLGGLVDGGSVDVLGLMQPQQKNQVAMMAANRGFRVERDEIEQSEELDLVPLNFADAEGDVRVHVLVASNALYGRMFAAARNAPFGDRELRVPAAEDLALLLRMSDDDDAVRRLAASPEFDLAIYNEKLIAIGLGAQVL